MGPNLLTQNPFAVLTFIVAPAILTNATSVLAMSTINRMLRTRERMQQLYARSEEGAEFRGTAFVEQVNRVEKQAVHLLSALRWIYTALGAFAAASLVTLLGAVAGQLGNELFMGIVVGAGLLLGVLGVAGLVGGCLNLLHATQLSLMNIREEAALIRARQEKQKNAAGDQGAV
jgi:tetrahydromethanopterin S-methyltransferase subunit B